MSVNHQKLPTPTSHQVNNLLHTLRGEQFRHAQNIRKSRTHISSALTHNSPTLPRGLIDPNHLTYDTKADAVAQKSASPCPGPGPPRSWILTKMKDVHDTPRWRAQALALCTSRSWQESDREARQPIPALSILCFQILLTASSTEFAEYIVPYIPPHLRRDLVRYTAVHIPLPNSKLWPLYQPDGHADGEIIVLTYPPR
ncbi:hypothetical protein BD779DRAFT_1509414 [Infundibulicybe gibba]|nr:hypothetical protein BD779DRAFT_1509414 [Infundibulicybe gibba]